MGLVETGVGLIPGGGGSKEMLIRANEHAAGGDDLDLFHALRPIFETIAMAKVGTSAEECRDLGFSAARRWRVDESRAAGRRRERSGACAGSRRIQAAGRELAGGRANDADQSAWRAISGRRRRWRFICCFAEATRPNTTQSWRESLANILAGGALSAPQLVSEQYVLDLEREAFVSLCGERKTQERIAHTLKTGKPLRN